MASNKNEILALVELYTGEMFAFTITKVRQKQAAEDIVQNTFLAAFESYSSFEHRSSAKTWLFSILKRKIADHFRLQYKNSSEIPFDSIEKFFDKNHRWKPEYRPKKWKVEEGELLNDPAFTKTLLACFENLPPKYAAVMQLKYLEETDGKAICTQLQITASNFWQIIHRARLQLRNCMELKWFKQ